MEQKYIKIRGAEENNLKNLDVDIPKDKLVVITGVSGSGKSSLAFDTIYAEGRRRYVESLSSYARQFLGMMEKPKVKLIEGLSPAIAINQKTTSNNPRSTVGTVTEIYDYIRLLYARVGKPKCPICGKTISKMTLDEITKKILETYPAGSKLEILAPIVREEKGEHEKVLKDIQKEGFTRAYIDGNLVDLSFDEIKLEKNKKHTIDVIIDRLILSEDKRGRLSESLELSLKQTNGNVKIKCGKESELFSSNYACPDHNIAFDEITPRIFSFNNPYGACSKCTGIGHTLKIDPELIIPDKEKTLYDGVKAFGMSSMKKGDTIAKMYFENIGKHYGVKIKNVKIKDLPKDFMDKILYGTNGEIIKFSYSMAGREIIQEKEFEGVIPTLERRHRETTSEMARKMYETYMRESPCPLCHGTRLKEKVLNIFIDNYNIYELTSMTIENIKKVLEKLELEEVEMEIAKNILKEIIIRLDFLIDVGLNYLTLSREAGTLSGGESQRIRLATQIGSGLTGVIYILDEPSIGLHQRDNDKLIKTLKHLRDLGNTVIVVEHDEDTMNASDYIIDIGPFAGEHGGTLVAAGSPSEIKKNKDSLTGKFLNGLEKIEVPKKRRKGNSKKIKIKGINYHNIKNENLEIPLGKLIAVTGISGSGKSSLITDVLSSAVNEKINGSFNYINGYEKISGTENIDKLITIDQSPIGRTPRSNPATYTGLFDIIRDIFAETESAKIKGYKKGRFSFNVPGGRCESCFGDGTKQISMYFLPDVFVECEVCGGKRYNSETLKIKYKDKNISDVLNMTVDEALDFFENRKNVVNKLKVLQDVGLGYIRLGQSSKTLSGGESQRIKLAKELSKVSTGKTLYILDEPTTGLHNYDIKKLVSILQRLVDTGNTVIVIEHNLDFIKTVDHIIDMGPEGGENGGKIIFEGVPEKIIKDEKNETGIFLKKVLS